MKAHKSVFQCLIYDKKYRFIESAVFNNCIFNVGIFNDGLRMSKCNVNQYCKEIIQHFDDVYLS